MESFLATDTDSKRVHIKLNDLHSCILECKKILERSNKKDNESYIKFCDCDTKIIRFETQIISGDYAIKSLKASSPKSFINFIVTLKRDLNQMRKIEYYV